jgi:S1-C subfamily serine protease
MQMKPIVQSLINAGYPVRQIDVSREPELARQYNITGIPCFVMLVDGQEVDRVVGGNTSSERLQQMFSRAHARIRAQSPDPAPPARPPAAPVSHTPVSWSGLADNAAGPPNLASGPISAPLEDAQWTREIDAKLLGATVRLRVSDAQGHSHGTGTIIDARQGEALVITCGHLFRDSKGQGEVSVELFEAGPQGPRSVGKVPGQVLSYDLDRDVALISIRPNCNVTVAPVAPPRTVVQRGDRAASVGCNNGQDPTIMATRITWLDRYQGPPNIETSGAPVF